MGQPSLVLVSRSGRVTIDVRLTQSGIFCSVKVVTFGSFRRLFLQMVQPNNSRSDQLGFLAAALGAFMVAASICNGAVPTQDTTEPIWPTKQWQTSSPEEQGMDSK